MSKDVPGRVIERQVLGLEQRIDPAIGGRHDLRLGIAQTQQTNDPAVAHQVRVGERGRGMVVLLTGEIFPESLPFLDQRPAALGRGLEPVDQVGRRLARRIILGGSRK